MSPASPVQAKCEQFSPHRNIAFVQFVQRSIVLSAPTVHFTMQLLRFENIHGVSSKILTHVKCDERIYLRSGDGCGLPAQAHCPYRIKREFWALHHMQTFQDRHFRVRDGNFTELTQPGFKTAALLGIRATDRAPRNERPYILIYDKSASLLIHRKYHHFSIKCLLICTY